MALVILVPFFCVVFPRSTRTRRGKVRNIEAANIEAFTSLYQQKFLNAQVMVEQYFECLWNACSLGGVGGVDLRGLMTSESPFFPML